MKLHAQPYDTSAPGFYFSDQDEYDKKVTVEEYEIQFIDGSQAEAELAHVWHLTQLNFQEFIDFCSSNSEHEMANAYQLLSLGYDDLSREGILMSDVTLQDYAEEIVDLSEVPEWIANYFDYEAFARDLVLGGDISTFDFNNINYIWDNHI